MPGPGRGRAAVCRSGGPGYVPSNRPSPIFLPFSLVTSVPSSSAWASKRSAISFRTRWRRLRSRDQGEVSNARRAAAAAARASGPPPAAPRPGRGVDGAAGGRAGRAALGLAAVGPLAQYRSGSGVDRLRDGVGPSPFAVDPVLGDLAHVRDSFG